MTNIEYFMRFYYYRKLRVSLRQSIYLTLDAIKVGIQQAFWHHDRYRHMKWELRQIQVTVTLICC